MRIVVGEGSCGIATGAKKTAAEFAKQIKESLSEGEGRISS